MARLSKNGRVTFFFYVTLDNADLRLVWMHLYQRIMQNLIAHPSIFRPNAKKKRFKTYFKILKDSKHWKKLPIRLYSTHYSAT